MTDRLDHNRVREILWDLRTHQHDGSIEDAISKLEAVAADVAAANAKPIRGNLAEAIAGSKLFEAGDPQARMDAYYYGFERTGFAIIDNILSAVAIAGKHQHSTEGWSDEDRTWGEGTSEADRIQHAAEAGANILRTIEGKLARG